MGEDGHGPVFGRIAFGLDNWARAENYLEREGWRARVGGRGPGKEDAPGRWWWVCAAGHKVVLDGAGEVPVREFCAKLYQTCLVCRPEEEEGVEVVE